MVEYERQRRKEVEKRRKEEKERDAILDQARKEREVRLHLPLLRVASGMGACGMGLACSGLSIACTLATRMHVISMVSTCFACLYFVMPLSDLTATAAPNKQSLGMMTTAAPCKNMYITKTSLKPSRMSAGTVRQGTHTNTACWL